ncbi:hypothetical protein E2C01_046979 [Portunus trituberculatus]|uniref:Uncharacterized protein n=1 Tax=Portunus trituberculatus TaxID=210409 RepID=A0A5B7G6H7_PORTR|nr:hypothetical protein [Portunus trituberculatus]
MKNYQQNAEKYCFSQDRTRTRNAHRSLVAAARPFLARFCDQVMFSAMRGRLIHSSYLVFQPRPKELIFRNKKKFEIVKHHKGDGANFIARSLQLLQSTGSTIIKQAESVKKADANEEEGADNGGNGKTLKAVD